MTIIISLGLASAALFAFLWAVRSGQYEDTYTPAVRLLHEDSSSSNRNEVKSETENSGDNINAG